MPDAPRGLPAGPRRFVRELKRRRVFRAAAVYAAAAFVIGQAAGLLVPALLLPHWTLTFVVVLLLLGFPIVVVLSWVFEVSAEGLRRELPAADALPAPAQDSLDTGGPGRPIGRTGRGIAAVLLVAVVGAGGFGAWWVVGWSGSGIGSRSNDSAHPTPRATGFRQVTFSGTATSPAISPAGDMIAYLERGEHQGDGGRLVLMDMEGQAAVAIAADPGLLLPPRWHPDGRRLLVYASAIGGVPRRGLYEVSRLDGAPRLLRAGWDYPAYDYAADGRIAVADGRTVVVLAAERPEIVQDSFALDQQYVGIGSVRWSPDGRRLLLSTRRDPGRIVLLAVTPGGEVTDALEEAGAWAGLGVWGPGGRNVYYQLGGAGRTEAVRRVGFDTRRGRFSGPPRTVISGLFAGLFDMRFEEDAPFIALDRFTRESHIVSATLRPSTPSAGADRHRITSGTAQHQRPVFSPDGGHVAFVKLAASGQDLYILELANGAERRVTFDLEIVRDAAWSADGARLAFAAESESGPTPMVVDAAGGPVRRVGTRPSGHGGFPRQFAWSPDGTLLLHQLPGHREFAVLDLATGAESDLLGEPAVNTALGPIFSPDGRRVALFLEPADGPRGLWIVDLETRARVFVTRAAWPLLWMRDDTIYLLGSLDSDDAILRVPATGGAAELHARLPEDCHDHSLSPDASRVACWEDSTRSDIWIAELTYH